jgi:hypothetical protein
VIIETEFMSNARELSKYTHEGVKTVATIADLVAMSGMGDNETVMVLGYHEAGDAGNGHFRWDSSSTAKADGGLILAPSAGGTGRWKRVYDGQIVMPEWWGAYGNNSNDDTSALQAALDSKKNVRLRGTYRITSTLEVKTYKQRIFSEHPNIGTYTKAQIIMDPSAEDDILMYVRWPCTLDGIALRGKGFRDEFGNFNVGHILVWGEDTLDGSNNGDVDIYFNNCTFGDAYTLVKVVGRGCYIRDCLMVYFVDGIVLDWPEDYEVPANPNPDHYPSSGPRAYTIWNNRFHGATGGIILRVDGNNAENVNGISFTSNFIDTRTRIFKGYLTRGLLADNVLINSGVDSDAAFRIDGGSDSIISNNVVYGMYDNSAGYEYEMRGGVYFSNCTNLQITGNSFTRVTGDVFSITGTNKNIIIRGNTMHDVCLDNAGSVRRYPVRISEYGTVDGLIITENMMITPAMPLNSYFVGLIGTPSVSNHVIRDNIFPSDWRLSNFNTTTLKAFATGSSYVVEYTGDGMGAGKTLSLPFRPGVVTVYALSGYKAGQVAMRAVGTTVGDDKITISNESVIVKGDFNNSGTTYMLFAQVL